MLAVGIVLFAYLIGSIPMAYIVGRMVKKIDIRLYGSGNVGAANISMQVGKRVIIPLGVFDVFVKGAFPVYLSQELGVGPWVAVITGLSTIMGHNWSLYLMFTGGRGIIVTLGVLLVLAWKELLALLLVGITGWLIFRSSAIWVAIAMVLLPVWSILFDETFSITVLCVVVVLIAAAKRVMSNKWVAVIPSWQVFVQRLLYDRDIANRDEWINRAPPEM